MGIKYQKLKPNHKIFVDVFLATEDQTEAARQAGSKCKNLAQGGFQMSKAKGVKEAIEEVRNELAAKYEYSVEKVLAENARIAFQDSKNFFNSDGTLKDLTHLPPEVSSIISSIEVEVKKNKKGEETKRILKVKTFDKDKALDKLFKFHGLYDKNNAQKADKIMIIAGDILKPDNSGATGE